jgi:predicted AlkP superfamily pyrophosphatase or phosphodiesterase
MRAVFAIVVFFGHWLSLPAFGSGKAEHVVVIVWDGMRPDFISPTRTPTLYRLAQDGVLFQQHHSVFLSATEVNGTAIATGSYPAHSGIMANREYRPAIDLLKPVGIESLDAVRAGDKLTTGRYLQRPTVAEILQRRGDRTAVAGTKPVALLHDRADRAGGQNLGVTLFAEKTLPTRLWKELVELLGPYPKDARPNKARDEWTTRALAGPLWREAVPRYSLLWLSEPDFSQHETGPGSGTSMAALKSCDNNLARVLRELEIRGIRDKTDVFVVSDHGFSTVRRAIDLAKLLQQAGFKAAREFKKPPAKNDVVVAGNGGSVLLYVIGRDAKTMGKLVDFLQGADFTGVLFTREPMTGTFSFEEANIHTSEPPDIMVALRWSDERSTNGTPGVVISDGTRKPGEGMHVTLSPFDLHSTLIAAGPDFRRGLVNELPSGNVDVAPTILHILGIRPPQPMDGRVLTEALTIGGPEAGTPKATQIEAIGFHKKFIWRQYLKKTELNGVVYLDEGNGNASPR